MCIVGVGLDQPLLLAVPSPEAQKNKDFVVLKLSEMLEKINYNLDGYKKIKKIIFVKDEWTSENGLVTPTLKIKRSKIDEKFSPKFNDWEKSNGSVVWE